MAQSSTSSRGLFNLGPRCLLVRCFIFSLGSISCIMAMWNPSHYDILTAFILTNSQGITSFSFAVQMAFISHHVLVWNAIDQWCFNGDKLHGLASSQKETFHSWWAGLSLDEVSKFLPYLPSRTSPCQQWLPLTWGFLFHGKYAHQVPFLC